MQLDAADAAAAAALKLISLQGSVDQRLFEVKTQNLSEFNPSPVSSSSILLGRRGLLLVLANRYVMGATNVII